MSTWSRLQRHAKDMRSLRIDDLFKKDSYRRQKYTFACEGITYDISKNLISDQTLELLICFAEEKKLQKALSQSFDLHSGIWNRSVTHPLWRAEESFLKANASHLREKATCIMHERCRLLKAASALREGRIKGLTGKAIKDVLHLGVGGSALGPRLLIDALTPVGTLDEPQKAPLKVHIISDIDMTPLINVLNTLDPETTLILIVSKTFTTQETLLNAKTAIQWLLQKLDKRLLDQQVTKKDVLLSHVWTVTAFKEKATAFGLDERHIFLIDLSLVGRFSLWSSVSLGAIAALGKDPFEAFLQGGRDVDAHIQKTPLQNNMPVLMALLGLWHRNFLKANAYGIIPYTHRLRVLIPYLQQLDMESNGKHISQDGMPIKHATSPLVWGDVGTPYEHAILQWHLQTHAAIPCDLIAIKKPPSHEGAGLDHESTLHHRRLLNHAFNVSCSLSFGTPEVELKAYMESQDFFNAKEKKRLLPHGRFKGNRSCSMLLLDELSPRHLGRLVAIYEYKIILQGFLWNINSFDQYGVEISKAFLQKKPEEIWTFLKDQN